MKETKVLVIGELIKDVFIYGNCPRLAPEGPFPVFMPTNSTGNMGGAGNVVANISSLCPDFYITFYHQVEEITKTRLVDLKTNYALLRIDANDVVAPITEDKLNEILTIIPNYNLVCISDYAKGLLTEETIEKIVYQSAIFKVPTFLDTKKILGKWSKQTHTVKINDVEYQNHIKANVNPELYCHNLIVTRGEKGAEYKGIIYPTNKVEVMDCSGAGDSFHAGLIVEYLRSYNIIEAIKYANKVAAVAVSRKGVVAVQANEVV